MDYKKNIINEFYSNAITETKEKYTRYFKGVVKFYGLKIPQIKSIFKKQRKEISKLDLEEKINLAFSFLESEYQESKSFGILILEKEFKNLDKNFLNKLKKIIEKNVYDWWTCDSLSGKVIWNMIRLDSNFSTIIQKWKNSKYMWLQRVSCVSFLKVARFGKHNDIIIDICSTTIQNSERFVQLGTGWILRELSLADLNLVQNFIRENYHLFSREWLRYAIEKMNLKDRKQLLKYKNW